MQRPDYFGRVLKTVIKTAVPYIFPVLFLTSCIESPMKPIAPTYDIQISIPIVQKTRTSVEFIADSSKEIEDSIFYYVRTFSMNKKPLEAVVAHPEPDSERVELGRFIVRFGPNIKTFTASSLGFDTNASSPVPNMNININANEINDTIKFDYVRVYYGNLELTITNNLPIPIDFPNDIVIRNKWNKGLINNNDEIARWIIDRTLQPGESYSRLNDISGKLLYGIMEIQPFIIHTTGSIAPIQFSSADAVSFSFRSNDRMDEIINDRLKADSAFAVIPNQDIGSDENSIFNVDDSITIKKATFRKGNLRIQVYNQIDLYTETSLNIKELFYSGTNTSFEKRINFNPKVNRSLDTIINMTDYEIVTNQNTQGTVLNYTGYIRVIDSRDEKKRVSRFDYVQTKISSVDSLQIKSITGNFPTQYLDVYEGTKSDFDFKNKSNIKTDLLRFRNLKMKLYVPLSNGNDSLPPAEYQDLTLIAKNSVRNKIDSIVIGNNRIDYNTEKNPKIDISQAPDFDNFVNELVRYFPDVPDSFFVRSKLIINPDYDSLQTYSITDTSSIYPRIEIKVPSIISIAGGYIREVESINIDEDIPEMKSVKTAELNLRFTNGIPVELQAEVCFFDTTHQDTVKFGPLGPIYAGVYDANLDRTISPSISNIKVPLNGDQINKIIYADSVSIQLSFDTDNMINKGEYVRILNTDAVTTQLSIKARCVINRQ